MKRVIFAAVSTVAGLTMLLQFKTRPAPRMAASGTTPTSSPQTTEPAPSSSPSPTTPPTTSAAPAASGTGTITGPKSVTGSAASTRYGPVQVKITVTNGKLTAVDA